MPDTEPGTEIAIRTADLAPSPYEPTTYEAAKIMAADFVGSKLTKCKTPQQALLLMATGRELGIPATTALRMIYVADFGQGDQVTLSADLMVALCLRSPLCEHFRCVASTDDGATYETRRRGDPPVQRSFTIEDARRAGLLSKGDRSNWGKYPAVMLRHRAASILAREVYPDVIGGFYTPDEAADVAAASAPAPLTPIGSPTTETIRDAEFTEVESDDARLARLTAALRASTSESDAAPVLRELTAAYPDKDHPHRAALRAVYLDRKAAKWAHEPAHDPVTGEVERQPGEDG